MNQRDIPPKLCCPFYKQRQKRLMHLVVTPTEENGPMYVSVEQFLSLTDTCFVLVFFTICVLPSRIRWLSSNMKEKIYSMAPYTVSTSIRALYPL